MKKVIPFGPYEPDRARYAPQTSTNILNVQPVQDGWGPLPSLLTFSDTLDAAPRGAYTGIAPDGTTAAFAWTATAAYQLESDGTWTDVKSGTYTLADNDLWTADTFGSRIIATNVTDGAEYWDIGSSSAWATLPGSPPNAKYVRTVGDFVVLGNISSAQNKVTWSGLNDSEQWTDGEELSGSQTFPDGGAVQGILEVAGGALIFQERCIRSMQFTPQSDYTFTFTYANPERGVVAPHSIVKIGPDDFVYLARDGFYRGLNSPIGAERVNKTFFDNIDPDEIPYVVGSADPSEKVVRWCYKTVSGQYNVIGYDWQLDRWFATDEDVRVMAWMATSAVSLEDLDTLFTGGMDSVTLNTDSDELSGGTLALAAFDSRWNLGYFTGAPKDAYLDTPTVQLNPNGRAFVRSVELIGDAPPYQDEAIAGIPATNGQYTVFRSRIGTSDYREQQETFTDYLSPSANTGLIHCRSSGRLHRIKFQINVGTTWSHVSAVSVDYVPAGQR